MDWKKKFLDNLTSILFDEIQPRHPKGTPEGGRWKSRDSGDVGSVTADDLSEDNIHRNVELISGALFNDPSLSADKWANRETIIKLKKEVETKLQERLKGNEDYEYFRDMYTKSNIIPIQHVIDLEGYSVERRLIDQWATSSGDDQPLSVFMQDMARDEFGLNDAVTNHFGQGARKVLDEYASPFRRNFDHEKFENGAKAFLREMYNETQERLASAGIKEVTLFRGWDDGAFSRSDLNKTIINDPAFISAPSRAIHIYEGTVRSQPMSSFSYSPDIAQVFVRTEPATFKRPAVTAIKVPASSILATPASGYGCLNELEMVVLGNQFKSVSVAYNDVGTPSSKFIKYMRDTLPGD